MNLKESKAWCTRDPQKEGQEGRNDYNQKIIRKI